MALLLGVLSLLFYLGCLVLVVVVLQWGLNYLGLSIDEKIMRIIWFLVLILALIAVVSFLAGGLQLPVINIGGRLH